MKKNCCAEVETLWWLELFFAVIFFASFQDKRNVALSLSNTSSAKHCIESLTWKMNLQFQMISTVHFQEPATVFWYLFVFWILCGLVEQFSSNIHVFFLLSTCITCWGEITDGTVKIIHPFCDKWGSLPFVYCSFLFFFHCENDNRVAIWIQRCDLGGATKIRWDM